MVIISNNATTNCYYYYSWITETLCVTLMTKSELSTVCKIVKLRGNYYAYFFNTSKSLLLPVTITKISQKG